MYYDNKLKGTKSNIKATWKVINEVINKGGNKPTSNMPQCIINNQDNSEITDPKEICAKFNEYFVNIAKKLAKNLPTSNHNFKYYLQNAKRTSCSMFLCATDQYEIKPIIRQ